MSAASKGIAEPKQKPAADLVSASKEAFGEYPEDVISPIKSAADALGWLEELFRTIEREALNERNGRRIKSLAEMGVYIASDMSNYAGCQYEIMIDRLRNAGIVAAEVSQ